MKKTGGQKSRDTLPLNPRLGEPLLRDREEEDAMNKSVQSRVIRVSNQIVVYNIRMRISYPGFLLFLFA